MNITFTDSYTDSADAVINVNGGTVNGGTIAITSDTAGSTSNTSGLMTAESELSGGGDIVLFASDSVALRGSRVKARGGRGGGSIRIGSDALGNRKASDVSIDSNSVLMADSTGGGSGGAITIAANNSVTMQGQATVTGSTGGNIDVSFGNDYSDSASSLLNVSATEGNAGTIHNEGDDAATLTASGDYIAASTDGSGGNIDMLAGENVFLLGALLNAEGSTGGGYIRVGGDFHGSGTTRRSQYTYVDKNTLILASVTDNGDGGKVVVWADTATEFDGTISAQGGSNGGDGGFVETSGKQNLWMYGIVSASSPHGLAGTWLMDPNDLTINGSATTNAGSSPNWVAGSGGGNVLNTNINTALNAGTSVALTASGTIEFSANISKTAGGDATLTATAGNDIIVDSGISITSTVGKLNVIFDSDSDASGVGTIQMVSDSITTNGGNITLGGGTNPINGYARGDTASSWDQYGIYLQGVTLSAGGGNILLRGEGDSTGALGILIQDASTISTTGSGTITMVGVGVGTNGNEFGVQFSHSTISAVDGLISITGTASTADTNFYDEGILIDGGGGSGTNPFGSTSITSTGTGGITLNGQGGGSGAAGRDYGVDLSCCGGAGTVTITTTNGALTINGTGGNTMGSQDYGVYISGATVQTTGSGNVSITGNGAGSGTGGSNIGVIMDGGAVQTSSTGTITINGTGGGGSGGSNYGVEIATNGVKSTVSGGGSITITGTGGTTGNNDGVILSGGTVSSVDSAIALTGTDGTSLSTDSYAVYIGAGSTVSTTNGAIQITGTGGSSTALVSYLEGVCISCDGTTASTVHATGTGNISITGTGGTSTAASSANMEGLDIEGGSTVSTNSGNLTPKGTGGNDAGAGSRNTGFDLEEGSIVTSTSGAISVTGIAGSSASNSLYTDATADNRIGTSCTSTGNISLYFNDTGGVQNTSDFNVYTSGALLVDVASSGKTMAVGTTGSNLNIGSSGTGHMNMSELPLSTASSITFGDTTNAGALTINYTTAFSKPVYFYSNSSTATSIAGTLTSTVDIANAFTIENAGGGVTLASSKNISTTSYSGTVTIIADGTFTTSGTNVIGGASASSAVTIEADTVTLSSTSATKTIETTGAITIEPYTSGRTIGIGTGTGNLSVTDTYLGYFNLGSASSLTLGSSSTGNLDFDDSGRTFSKPLPLLSNSNITLDSQLNDSAAGGSGAVVTVAATGNFINNSGSGASTIHLTGTSGPVWYVYSTSAASDTNGASAMSPTTTGASGNMWFYSSANPNDIWTGAISTAWNLAGNWGSGIPTSTCNVTIANVTNEPVLSANTTVANLTFNSGSVLDLHGYTLTVSGNLTTTSANITSSTGGLTLITDHLSLGAGTTINTTGALTILEYTAGNTIGIGTNATGSIVLTDTYRMGGKGKRGKILIEESALDAFLQSCKVEGKPVDASSLNLKNISLR